MGLLYEIISDHKKIKKMLGELEMWTNGKSDISAEEVSERIKELREFWDGHEEREEMLFKDMVKKNMSIPFEKLDTAHEDIKKHWNSINAALKSKDNSKIKKVLGNEGKIFIEKIKKHMEYEEPIFNDLNFNLPFSQD